jgi:hypothetical protein
MNPPRISLADFPDVVLHAEEAAVKKHSDYRDAKMGDIVAADRLVEAFVGPDEARKLQCLIKGKNAELVPIHALESDGVNEIPAALAQFLSKEMRLSVNDSIVQLNTVGHTGASGYHRLANQALFAGEVMRGQHYLLADDFVGQGGTLANLIGYVEHHGGHVLGATVLTGKPYSVRLAPEFAMIQALRDKHGRELEDWWRQEFGFDFTCLTRSETRYLENSPDAQTIRDRIVAAGLEGSAGVFKEP